MSKSYSPLKGVEFSLFSNADLEKVENGTYRILEEVGIKVTDQRAKSVLKRAGGAVDGDRVFLPPELVKDSIKLAPDSLTLYDQKGKDGLELEKDNVYFGASIDSPSIFDPLNQTYRECKESDIGKHVRLVDELSNISFLMPAGFAADHDSKMAEIVATKQVLLNTDKPFIAITESLDDLKAVHQMARVKANIPFGDRPFFVNYAEPISPLVNPDSSVQKVLYCAEENIPLLYSPFLAMGATAPQHPATAVAQAVAESLFGLVLQQQINPGGSFVLGGMPSMMDMETANFSYGAPDLQVMSAGISELGHHLGLPVFGTAGTGDSKLFDGQAIIEALSSSYMAALSGGNLVHDLGLFGSAKILIPEMIVVMDEIIDLLRNTLIGLDGDGDLRIDLLKEVGPGGEFVSHHHTMRHFKESWYPRFIDRVPFNNQDLQEVQAYCEKISRFVEDFFEEDQGAPIVEPGLRKSLRKVQEEYASKKF